MNEIEIIIREKDGPTPGAKMAIMFLHEECLNDQVFMEERIWELSKWYMEIE